MTHTLDWQKAFSEKFKFVSFEDRAHTCEAWNGLGEDMYGKAVLTEAQKEELIAFISQVAQQEREANKEWCDVHAQFVADVMDGTKPEEAYKILSARTITSDTE